MAETSCQFGAGQITQSWQDKAAPACQIKLRQPKVKFLKQNAILAVSSPGRFLSFPVLSFEANFYLILRSYFSNVFFKIFLPRIKRTPTVETGIRKISAI